MRSAVRLAVLCAGLATVGCGFTYKPYTNDPLLRGGRGVWLARDPAPQPSTARTNEPVEPPNPPTSRAE